LHLVGCLYYLYQWCTVKQISDNEIYLLIKNIKSDLWRVAKRLSYIEDARCIKVKYGKYHVRYNVFLPYFMRMYRTLDTLHWEKWEKYGVLSSTTRLLFQLNVVCYNKTWYKCIRQTIKTDIISEIRKGIVSLSVLLGHSSEISPTRCNNSVFILRIGFTLHVSGDNLTHHQEYICCIWPQVSRLT
jgi:hypothetical protein